MLKVSIIIPVYNVADFIAECLHSVEAQTYANLEVLLIDDRGTDRSMTVAEEIIARSERKAMFRILCHGQNRGLSAARNTGIRAATGDYLFFLDSDDTLAPRCIQALVETIAANPGTEAVFGSASTLPEGWTRLPISTDIAGIPAASADRKWIKEQLLKRNFLPITAWNKLLERAFVTGHSLYFKEGILGEDRLWTFLLAKHVRSIAFCKEKTYYYRHNANGITSSEKTRKYINSGIITVKECLKNFGGTCLRAQLAFIFGETHLAYCIRYGFKENKLRRYAGSILYFFRILLGPYPRM